MWLTVGYRVPICRINRLRKIRETTFRASNSNRFKWRTRSLILLFVTYIFQKLGVRRSTKEEDRRTPVRQGISPISYPLFGSSKRWKTLEKTSRSPENTVTWSSVRLWMSSDVNTPVLLFDTIKYMFNTFIVPSSNMIWVKWWLGQNDKEMYFWHTLH